MSTVVRQLDYFSQSLSWMWLQGDANAFHDASLVALRTLSEDTLTQIAVADAQGRVQYSNLSWGKPESASQATVSIADREHFKVHLQANEPLFFISDPIKGRISQKWTIQFSRGLWDAGEFKGVLVLSVSAEHLAIALKAIFPDPVDAASVVKNDGTYLARSFYLTDVLGQRLPATRPFIQHREENKGTYETPGAVDQLVRFYSWHRVDGYPLVVLVGLGSEKAMTLIDKSIQDSHWQSGAVSALLLTAFTLGAVWTQRSVRSTDLQRAVDALAIETSRLNTVLECFPGGILLKDTGDSVVFVNDTWPQLMGLQSTAADLTGMHDSELRTLLGPEAAAWLSGQQAEGAAGPTHEVTTEQGRHLEIDHVEIVQNGKHFGAVSLVRDITDRKQHELKLTQLASTDTLTGLPNRRSFMHGINTLYDAALRDNTVNGVVMMLDIDRFKRVNDTYGHATGDIVLQHVAKLIKASIRTTDVPGRYGGEEFVVLQPYISMQDGLATAERIRKAMEESCINVDGHEIRITISIGVSQVGAASHPETALQQADLALYHAKNTGRNRVCQWEAQLSQA